jgi:hypothetical protein
MATRKLLVATTHFSCEVDGREVLVHIGDVVAATDKRVKGREELFEPYDPAKPKTAG